MAMTNQQQTEAYQFFAIAFGATPGVEYMNQLDEAYSYGMTTQEIVNVYTTKPAFTAQYPTFFSNQQFANALVSNVVGSSASETAKAEARADIVGALNAGWSRGDVIYQIFTNLAAKDPADPVWGNTAVMLANKVAVSKYATEELLINGADQNILDGVTSNDATVAAAKEALSETGAVGMLRFTVEGDVLSGDAGNNIFKAVVGQNSLGQQVNTFGSGDEAHGLGGTDTLNAKVTTGVFAGSSENMPIEVETTSIEIVNFDATLAGVASDSDSRVDQVFVSAEEMSGVQQLWSNGSEADLTVMQMTTKGLDRLSDMTIGMAYTGNADSNWGASDMRVYFDQDYLVPEATRTNPVVDFLAMNEDAYDYTNGAFPLSGVFFRELQFTLNGTTYDLTQYLGENPLGTGEEITTYTGFLAAMQSALVQLKADNAGDAALQTVTASFGQTFYTDVNPITLVQREGVGIRLTVDGLTNGVSNALTVVSTDLEVARAAASPVPNNNRYEIADASPAADGSKLAINVALEKVGLAGDGGALIIGSMNKDSGNEWDAVNTVVDGTTSGINEFNVTVYGNSTKSSSLAGLHSTNNNLRVVTVATDVAQTVTFADLTIGNSNTNMSGFFGYENALKDVQTFDAMEFKGDLTLFAALTDEVTDKYLNLVDAAPDAPGADNLNFDYNGGVGNDSLNLTISAGNGAFSGSATREDFLMNATIDGGNGDDAISLAIVNNSGNLAFASFGPWSDEATVANWYDNQALNSSLRIDGGAGNDTIRTPGSGNVVIDGGTGNDTVYADNAGSEKAVWAFNVASGFEAARHQLDNLQSDDNDSYSLFKTDVRVSFLGFEATARIADVTGTATDLHINQAIKKAINSDPVLSKLLLATDGPANTLVVSSLIDGVRVENDLAVTLVAPAVSAFTAGELLQLSTWYGMSLTAPAAKALIDAQVAIFNTNLDGNGDAVYNQVFARDGAELDGTNSLHTSDNHITGGLGNDVIVLGTGRLSNDTVVYNGFGNGTDTIVNFDTNWETVTTETPVPGTPETFTVTFADLTIANNTLATTVEFGDSGAITLDDGVVLASLIPAEDVAFAFANGYVAGAGTAWNVTYVPGTAEVTFVRAVAGDITNVVPADFVFTNATGPVTIGDYVEGTDNYAPAQAATFSEFVVDYNGTVVNDGTAGDFTFNGATINTAVGDGPITLSNKVAAAAYDDWTAVDNLDGTVTFTAKVAGPQALPTPADLGVEMAGAVAAEPAVAEVVTVDFAGTTVQAGETITFEGFTTAPFLGAETPAQVVAAIEAANAANPNWTFVDNLDGTLTITDDTPGLQADVVPADFVLNPASAPGTLVTDATVTQQGDGILAETVDVDFGGTTVGAGETITFDGVTTAPFIGTETPEDVVAAIFLATGGATANWTVTNPAGLGVLNLVDSSAGTPTDLPAGAFVLNAAATGTLAAAVTVDTQGEDAVVGSPGVDVGIDATVVGAVGADAVAQTGAVVVEVTEAGAALDYLDFSAFDAQGVYVDGALVAGSAPTALNQTYITLVETANEGIYTISQMKEAGALGTAGDTVVGIIGVADFGAEQDFVAQNFIL